MLDELVGLRAVRGLHRREVPFQLLADAIGDVAEQRGFRERPGVVETAGRGAAGLDRFDPFTVMPDGILDERLGLHEAFKIFLRQEDVATVVRDELAF